MDKEKLSHHDKEIIWHPFTQMADYRGEDPIIIEYGEGAYLIDVNGKRYLDGVSSLWVNVHGHSHPKLNQALKQQIDKISHSTLLGLSNVPSIEFAEKLLSVAPKNLSHVFYSDNGSTAVEIALKIAFQYFQQTGQKQKTKFITFENAYHGDTIGAVGVGGIDLFHSLYKPLLFDAYRAPHPYPYRCQEIHSSPLTLHPSQTKDCRDHCLAELESILAENHESIAACILEPLIQGAAGMITAPKGFLKGVRELCTKYDVFLILDEVATGFGRTGTMFACEQESAPPDILCAAKGITGGYLPLAVTLTTDEIYRSFLGNYEELKTFFHGHTYTGNPLACAVAKASLELFEEERTLDRIKPLIAEFSDLLKNFYELENVGDVRQCGLMAGIEIVTNRQSKETFPLAEKIPHKITLKAREKGLIIRPLGPVMVLMPPLCANEVELNDICEITFNAIGEIIR